MEKKTKSSRWLRRDSCFLIRYSAHRGISLVEVVVGTAILFLVLTGFITAYNMFVRAGLRTLSSVQATYLLEEGVEAVSTMRDFGWAGNIGNLTAGTNYYLAWNGSRFVSTTTATTTNSTFTRYFTLSNVNRDASDNIAAVGTNDPNTKKATVVVSWPQGATTTSRSVSAYLTNLFGN